MYLASDVVLVFDMLQAVPALAPAVPNMLCHKQKKPSSLLFFVGRLVLRLSNGAAKIALLSDIID